MKPSFNKDDPRTFKYNNEDVSWVSPSDTIACHDCAFKLDGLIGYRNGYCKKYIKGTSGKPDTVLFKNAKCDFYKQEEA